MKKSVETINGLMEILTLNPGTYSGFNENGEVVWIERYENEKGFAIKVCPNKTSGCSDSMQVTRFNEAAEAVENYFENFKR